MKNTFFLVWNEDGGAPKQKHRTFESAKAEAERLMKLYGGVFHVLKCVATGEYSPFKWDISNDIDIPF